ncbi:MAG: tRNA (adenosine(37)-N6)-threonylcarbamoyltransferase complex ATPase subunit type 1 TsaE [Minisyncoccia bacterium]
MKVAREELPAFAEGVLKKIQPKTSGALLLFLLGQLGSGKTTFMQAFASALGVEDTVQSPTFVLMKKYELPKNSKGPSLTPGLSKDGPPEFLGGRIPEATPLEPALRRRLKESALSFKRLIHIDAYRLEDPHEFAALRPEEFLQDPQNIVCIEWAENISSALPAPDLVLKFSSEGMGEGEREIEIYDSGFTNQE